MKKSIVLGVIMALLAPVSVIRSAETSGTCVEDVYSTTEDNGNVDTWTIIGTGASTYDQQCASADANSDCEFDHTLLVELWETDNGVTIDSGAIDVARYKGNECS